AAPTPCRAPPPTKPLPAACRLRFVHPATDPAAQTGAGAVNPQVPPSSSATDCFATPAAPEPSQTAARFPVSTPDLLDTQAHPRLLPDGRQRTDASGSAHRAASPRPPALLLRPSGTASPPRSAVAAPAVADSIQGPPAAPVPDCDRPLAPQTDWPSLRMPPPAPAAPARSRCKEIRE